MVKSRRYVPRRGDIVWLSFTPQAGHEQAGRRPALVLSPSAYNGKVGLGVRREPAELHVFEQALAEWRHPVLAHRR